MKQYSLSFYPKNQRFVPLYNEVYRFLLQCADRGCHEHFHWGRFEWMITHTMLDADKTDRIALFRDESGEIVGMATYDTVYDGRWHLIHALDDLALLVQMLDAVSKTDDNRPTIKVNAKDTVLCALLTERGFFPRAQAETVLQFDLAHDLSYTVSAPYQISPCDFVIDPWQYQLVIHRGFDGEGIPEPWDSHVFEPTPNYNASLKVFAVDRNVYCAHCGIWYTSGDTAYIEPVVTVPTCRKQGLASAVVREAMRRAKTLGAKRAIVISDQPFYHKIGFTPSSEVWDWNKE